MGLAQQELSWQAVPQAPWSTVSLQQLCGVKVEPTPNGVYKQEYDVILTLFSAWLDAQKALVVGVGSLMKEELGKNPSQFWKKPKEV